MVISIVNIIYNLWLKMDCTFSIIIFYSLDNKLTFVIQNSMKNNDEHF
jgi:hypothetical protein